MKAVASHSIRPRAGAARASDPTVAGRRAADITSRAIRAINPIRARQAPAKNLVPGATITVRVAMTRAADLATIAGRAVDRAAAIRAVDRAVFRRVLDADCIPVPAAVRVRSASAQ